MQTRLTILPASTKAIESIIDGVFDDYAVFKKESPYYTGIGK